MPKDDPFYYVKTNDINSLKRLYSENKYIIAQKDNKEELFYIILLWKIIMILLYFF